MSIGKMKVGFPLWTASVQAAPWCVCVIDIGQSSHYWNSSAQSRRKGMKNKNRTSFDDIGTYSASATYCWKIFRLLQAKWVVETLRWIICIMQFLILIISWQTLLYTIIVTFFSSEIASFPPTISFFNFYFTYVVCLNFALSLDATVYTTTVKRNWYEPI